MKFFYLLLFVLFIQICGTVAKKKKNDNSSGQSRSDSGGNSSNDSGSGSSNDSGSDSDNSDDSGSSNDSGSDSDNSNDSGSGSDNSNNSGSSNSKKHKKHSKKPETTSKPTTKPQNGLETVLTGLPSPLNNVAVSIKISINSIVTSLSSIKTGTLAKLSKQIISVFDSLARVTGVSGLINSFEDTFARITLTFSSLESGLGQSVVEVTRQAIFDIQTSLSGLLLLISTKSGSLNVCNINTFVKEIAEHLQTLMSVDEALVSATSSSFDTTVFESIINLQLIITPILYTTQWVLSLTAYTSLSVNGTISPELSSVILSVSTILQNVSKIIVTIANAPVGNFSKIVSLLVSPINKLWQTTNTSLSTVSGTEIKVTIKEEQITSNTATTKIVYNK